MSLHKLIRYRPQIVNNVVLSTALQANLPITLTPYATCESTDCVGDRVNMQANVSGNFWVSVAMTALTEAVVSVDLYRDDVLLTHTEAVPRCDGCMARTSTLAADLENGHHYKLKVTSNQNAAAVIGACFITENCACGDCDRC